MPRIGQTAREQNLQKETLNISQKIKLKGLKKKGNNYLLIIENKLILKKKPKDYGLFYEVRKRIKDVEMEKRN